MKVVTNYSIQAPRITFCSTSYIRCDCELWYDPIYLGQKADSTGKIVNYNLERYQCGTNRSKISTSIQFNNNKCGSSFRGGAVAALKELKQEMDTSGVLSEASLLRYARHVFIPADDDTTSGYNRPTDTWTTTDDTTNQQPYTNTVLDLSEIMISCKYMGSDCKNENDWSTFLDYRHGICFSYVGNQKKMMRGPDGGLSMILRAHTETMLTSSIGHAGFHFFVESANEPISLVNPMMVGVGTQTDIGLEVTHIDDTSIYENGNGLYSKCSMSKTSGLEACNSKCILENIRENCQCEPLDNEDINIVGSQTPSSTTTVESEHVTCSMFDNLGFRDETCSIASNAVGKCCGIVQNELIKDSLHGLKNVVDNQENSVTSDIASRCIEKCQFPCDRTLYKTSTRASTWPSTQYSNKLAHTIATERNTPQSQLNDLTNTLRSEMSSVAIYPSSTNIMNIENSVAFGIAALFGSIGGTLGLFIGFSIITVVELVDFVLRFCRILTRRTAELAVDVTGDVAGKLGVLDKKKSIMKKHNTSSSSNGVGEKSNRNGTVIVPVKSEEVKSDGNPSSNEMMNWATEVSGETPPPLPPKRVEIEEELLRLEEEERLRNAEELKAKNAALHEKQQKEIEEAKNKLTTAVASNDPTTLQSILEDLENDPEYVLEALATEMKQAQELLATLSAALSAAAQAELMKAKVDQAQQDLKNVVNKVKMCSVADKSYMEALPEGERHLNAIQKDNDLFNVMKSEVEQAKTVLANKTTEIQLNILEEIQNAMKDKENGDQYDRLKLALENFDTFHPDMNSPSNAVMIGEARRMLEILYEVWKLKQLLMNLDQKAIAQVKSMNKPIDEVHQVIRAVLLLLGEDPKALKDWKSCRVNISRTGKESLKRRISAFTMDTVTDKAQAICEKIMSKIDLKRVEEVSSVVAIFYAFCAGALKLKRVE